MNILVIGPSWVGDMVMAQCLFKILKQRFSGCRIDVLAPAWSRPIISAMPEVYRSIDMPVGHGQLMLKERLRLGKSLRNLYDWSIVLPNSLKSALVPAFAKIPKRTGWLGEVRFGLLNDIHRLDKTAFPYMIQRFAALGLPRQSLALPLADIPAPELIVSEEAVAEALATYKCELRRPVLALCPGAEFGGSKQWPAAYYAEAAKSYIARGWQIWLFGSKNDESVCSQTVSGFSEFERSHTTILAGRTTLQEAMSLLSVAGLVISNDSGLMHVAAALKRPLIGIYGSTSPEFTPPLGRMSRIAKHEIECSPCFQRTCPLGHNRCMKDLMPEQVITAADELLSVISGNGGAA